MSGFTHQDIARIAAQPGYGVDTAVTAPGNAPEAPAIPANLARADVQGVFDGKSPMQLLFESTVTGFCQSHDLPAPEFEYKFHPRRRWRADAAIPSLMVLIELEGGTWTNGRHNRALGYEADCEKYNAAALLGWFVLRFTTAMLQDGRMLATLAELPPF